MAKTLKVGVIGVGGIAKTHFPGWNDSPHAEMAAFSDLNEEVLAKTAAQFGVTKTYAKPEDLIADPDIDIVDICTPNMYHTPLTVAALEAGKHVLCEKPLAPEPADIKKKIKARDKSGKLLMTRSTSASGLGQGAQGRSRQGHAGRHLPRPLVDAAPLRRAAPTRLHMKQHSGGGPCIDIGVHILDLTLWMMGHPKPSPCPA